MKSALPAAIVVLGIVLLGASFFWGILFPATRNWTDDKSARMSELGNQANLLKFKLMEAKAKPNMHAGSNAAEVQAEYDKVSAEYKLLYDEFEGIKESPKTSSSILQWAGIAFVAAGAMATFATRSA